jgi:hypothetical protein
VLGPDLTIPDANLNVNLVPRAADEDQNPHIERTVISPPPSALLSFQRPDKHERRCPERLAAAELRRRDNEPRDIGGARDRKLAVLPQMVVTRRLW